MLNEIIPEVAWHGSNMLLEAFFGSIARETILNALIPVIVPSGG